MKHARTGLLIAARMSLAILGALLILAAPPKAADAPPIKVLLLGDKGHHRPAVMARIMTRALAKQGIKVDYTADVTDLTAQKLAGYDVLAIFRDSGDLPAAQEAALLAFVEGGKGLVAIHCASHCFRNSDRYTALVGGRFLRHGTDVFRTTIIDAQHPAMRGVESFESWDETYVHNQLAADIRVLMTRREQDGYEPYTWVRSQGKGRVFYTAHGHDERSWETEGFQKLIAQGIRWAAGRVRPDKVEPFRYTEANVPNYLPGKAWGTVGQPIRQMQLPLSPAESMKHMHLPEGFEVKLFAAEPDIARPIAMAWDERGRLWVAETVDYPNDMQERGHGHDRIRILEDTDGDGRADKFTVFADKLSIPTSLVFADGGLIVAQAPDTLFLKSSKGDDHADVRKVLFSGWGTHDTHAGPSNLRRGLDNWIWGTVGYSGFSGTIGGQDIHFGQGVFRFKPDGSRMEFLTSTSNNTWGLGLAETGEIFASTANNEHSVHLAIPNRYYEAVRGWHGRGSIGIEDHKKFHPITEHVRQVDFHGGFTAAAGHALYTARSFPKEYWDRAAFVCEPTGHLVHVNWLSPRGSGWVARDGWNMLASDDEWTAPTMAEVGPDGALWMIDWYNFIVQHNPTPAGFKTGKGAAYVTPLRDKTHGRIYRIVPKGEKLSPSPRLDRAGRADLVAALGHDNLGWRQTAQRLLVDGRQTEAIPELTAIVREGKNESALVHALWTLQGLGAFTAPVKLEVLEAARANLKHSSPVVRRAALGVLPRTTDTARSTLAAGCLTSPDACLRRDALLALSEMPALRATAEAVASMLGEPRNSQDRWIPSAAICAAARCELDFLEAAARTKGTDQAALTRAARVVAEHVARKPSTDAAGRLLALLETASPAVAEAVLTGVASGWPAGRTVALDASAEARLKALAEHLGPGALLQLAGLLRSWGQQDRIRGLAGNIKKSQLARLTDEKLSEEARLAAARDLITLGVDEETLGTILEQITPKADPSFSRGLIEAVGQSSAAATGAALLRRWGELTPAARSAALAVLLRRPAWTRDLLAALEKDQVDRADLSFDHVQQLSTHPDRAIAEKARKLLAQGGRLPSPDRQKVLDTLLPLARRHGDAARGKKVFENNCAKCHRHGDTGASVGPDLSGIAVRPRADILTDVLDPNRSVEGNYRQYTVETKKGTVLTGLLVAETKTFVELLDSDAKKQVVLRDDIESLNSSKLSLMPEGFEKLPADDLVSLLDFLTARSKYLPLPLGKAATITSVRGMFNDPADNVERLVFRTWGRQTAFGVPFQVIDPRGGSLPNVILLHGPQGKVCREMPKSATITCGAPARAVHLLSGVGGWCFPYGKKGSVSMIVRLHYADGKSEDHPLRNGVHMADYIRVVDVPDSKLAFRLRGQQVRYLAIKPERQAVIERIEFVKGADDTAPVVMAVTIEPGE
jgi:putative membrane-bound dehydrogenase-like protein